MAGGFIYTTSERLKSLPIKEGQLIFIENKERIAFDCDGKRKFYNQVNFLERESQRIDLESPVEEAFYFVHETKILWNYYQNKWILVADPSPQVIIQEAAPTLQGDSKKLYVNKSDKTISVWDDHLSNYAVVADTTAGIPTRDISSLFNR